MTSSAPINNLDFLQRREQTRASPLLSSSVGSEIKPPKVRFPSLLACPYDFKGGCRGSLGLLQQRVPHRVVQKTCFKRQVRQRPTLRSVRKLMYRLIVQALQSRVKRSLLCLHFDPPADFQLCCVILSRPEVIQPNTTVIRV